MAFVGIKIRVGMFLLVWICVGMGHPLSPSRDGSYPLQQLSRSKRSCHSRFIAMFLNACSGNRQKRNKDWGMFQFDYVPRDITTNHIDGTRSEEVVILDPILAAYWNQELDTDFIWNDIQNLRGIDFPYDPWTEQGDDFVDPRFYPWKMSAQNLIRHVRSPKRTPDLFGALTGVLETCCNVGCTVEDFQRTNMCPF